MVADNVVHFTGIYLCFHAHEHKEALATAGVFRNSDHDKELFEAKKAFFLQAGQTLNEIYGREVCEVSVKDQYYNMYDVIKDNMECVSFWLSTTALLMLLFFDIYNINDNFNSFFHIIDTCEFMTAM